MAIQYVCDECKAFGNETQIGRFEIRMSSSSTHNLPKHRYDGELCKSCVASKVRLVEEIFRRIAQSQ